MRTRRCLSVLAQLLFLPKSMFTFSWSRWLPVPPRLPVAIAALLGSVGWGALGLGDALLGRTGSLGSIAAAVAVSMLAGAVLGAWFGLVSHWLSALKPRWWVLVWLVVGLAWGTALAEDLGAFDAIGGEHSKLGWMAAVGSIALGGYLSVLAWLCQPSKARPRGVVSGRHWGLRVLAVTAIAALAAVLLVVDARVFPLTYPAAHAALRWGSVVSVFGALLLATGHIELRPARIWGARIALGVLLAAALPLALMLDGEEDRVVLDAALERPTVGLSIRALRGLTDVDGDGYSAFLGGGDCAPFSSAVHPGAMEVPGNGTDDNCLGGDAKVRQGLQVSSSVALPKTPSPVSVIIISIDTLRADRMSVYGYPRKTMPEIERWSKSALRFDRAYTGGPWTALAMSSMFRGVYPRRIAWTFLWETSRLRLVRDGEKLPRWERKKKVFATPINDHHRTLSEWLSLRGMRTAAVVDDGRSHFLHKHLGVAGDWDHYEMARLRGKSRGDASVTQKAMARLKKLAKGPPFLLWAHYFGPHERPTRADGKPRYGKTRSDLYDHKLHSTDAEVGKLLDAIDQTEHDRPIAVILTADHGEEFLSDHRGHGANLSDDNIRIPLMVRGPGFAPGISRRVTSLVDVLPTVLRWTETPVPSGLDGRALQEAGDSAAPRTVLSETWRFSRDRTLNIDRIAAINDAYKLERNLIDHTAELRRIRPNGVEDSRNLIEVVEPRSLSAAITLYLEQNRQVQVAD